MCVCLHALLVLVTLLLLVILTAEALLFLSLGVGSVPQVKRFTIRATDKSGLPVSPEVPSS